MKKSFSFSILSCLFIILYSISFAEIAAVAPAATAADGASQVSSLAAIATTFLPILIIGIIVIVLVIIIKRNNSSDSKNQIDASVEQTPEELKKLAQLNKDGILSDEEYEIAKKKILKI